MDEQNPFDYYEPSAPAPKPKPKKRKVPKKKSVLVKRKAKESAPAPQGPMKVFLTIQHTVNGQPYGPGLVEGPPDLIMALRENEQRNAREEQGLTAKRAHVMLGGGRTIEVRHDFFDDPGAMVGQAPVALSQSFKGFTYTPPEGAQTA